MASLDSNVYAQNEKQGQKRRGEMSEIGETSRQRRRDVKGI